MLLAFVQCVYISNIMLYLYGSIIFSPDSVGQSELSSLDEAENSMENEVFKWQRVMEI